MIKCMHALGGKLDEQASCEGVMVKCIHALGGEEVAQNTGRTQNVCRCSGDHQLAQVGQASHVGELVVHALLRVEDELYLRVMRGRTQNVCRCSGDHQLAQVGQASDVGELVAHALLRVEDELYLRVMRGRSAP